MTATARVSLNMLTPRSGFHREPRDHRLEAHGTPPHTPYRQHAKCPPGR